MTDAQRTLDRFTPRLAWEPFFPSRTNRWDRVKIAHLYRRAAFGAQWDELESGVAAGMSSLVGQLMTGRAGHAAFETEVDRLRPGVLDSREIAQLQALWFHRLLSSPHPLLERMTLFWHDHFATSNSKVADVLLMSEQHETIRRHALGHFGELLHAMTRDPAMLVWLDSDSNRKGAPNENYAREVFELFSLGDGNYTEDDIKEAARALTGWSVRDGRAFFDPAQHDDGEKTIFGQTGHWTSGDVVRLALAQPACPRFIIRKLFGEFVSDAAVPSDELLQPLADGFRQRDYDMAWLVERMISSWVFYSDAAIRQRVKSPVEFVVETVRSLNGRVSPRDAAQLCGEMGQALFLPPSVKGWDGGRDWINSSTLLLRQNTALELTRGNGAGGRCDPADLPAAQEAQSPEQLAKFFLDLFHQQASPDALTSIVSELQREQVELSRQPFARRSAHVQLARSAAHLALTMPEYQLG
jgi:uncharacterized protein (DUF1800 family)